MAQIYDLRTPGGMISLYRDKLSLLFPGGNLSDPTSPVRLAFAEYLSEQLNGVVEGDSPAQVGFDEFPEELKSILLSSYVYVEHMPITYNRGGYRTDGSYFLGSCTRTDVSLNLIIPVQSILESRSSNYYNIFISYEGVQGGVFAEFSLSSEITSQPEGGGSSLRKGLRFYGSYDLNPSPEVVNNGLRPDFEDAPSMWGVRTDYVIYQYSREFKKVSDGGLVCISGNINFSEADQEEVESAVWLVRSNSAYQDFSDYEIPIPVILPVNLETESLDWQESAYGVVYSLEFNVNELAVKIGGIDDDGLLCLGMDHECGALGTGDLRTEDNPDFSGFYATYREAHEAYPNLFPLDTGVGLSATKKHFIRIS